MEKPTGNNGLEFFLKKLFKFFEIYSQCMSRAQAVAPFGGTIKCVRVYRKMLERQSNWFKLERIKELN